MDKVRLGALGEVSMATDSPSSPSYLLLLAHGAGAGYNHEFLDQLAQTIARCNGAVIRFNFPYMEQGKKFPGSPKTNIEAIGEMISFVENTYSDLPIFLSGKSYGGRMSSHWVVNNPGKKVKGLIYFGFPLHAPGKVSKDRAAHLYQVNIPQYFIQGTNDALANFELITEVVNSCTDAELLKIEHGDHSFKVPKKFSNKSHPESIEQIGKATDDWIQSQR